MHVAPAGLVALPLALIAGTAAVVTAAARAPAHDRAARVELEVAGVLPMPEGSAAILVLREKGKDTILPLVVPNGRDFSPGHASGSSLIGRAIEALGARVAEVRIDRAEESSSGARVRISQNGKELELRAVPSESVALAVSAGVPIVTSRKLLDEEGLTAADLARAHAKARRHETRL
jgi:bifunctional DNase/RNase